MKLLDIVISCLFPWMGHFKEKNYKRGGLETGESRTRENTSDLFDLSGSNSILRTMANNMTALEKELTRLSNQGDCSLCVGKQHMSRKSRDDNVNSERRKGKDKSEFKSISGDREDRGRGAIHTSKSRDKEAKSIRGDILLSVILDEKYQNLVKRNPIQAAVVKCGSFCSDCSKKILLTEVKIKDMTETNKNKGSSSKTGELRTAATTSSLKTRLAGVSKDTKKRGPSEAFLGSIDLSSQIFKKNKWSLYYDSFSENV